MKQFDFKANNVPVLATTEVLVVGSGTAGTAAETSVAESVIPRGFDVGKLRATLSENGVIL